MYIGMSKETNNNEEVNEKVDALYAEGFNVEDGNDPLSAFLDVNLDDMSVEELKKLHADLSELSNNPKAVKRVLEKGAKGLSDAKKTEANNLFASLGINITI